jgi:hypothetical protein
VNIIELAGNIPDDGDTGESVGIAIARAEVLLSLTSILVGEITALDLARTDALTLGVNASLSPDAPDIGLTEGLSVRILRLISDCREICVHISIKPLD